MTLVGTIPAAVAGDTYEIPVTIWITDSFPARSPPVYVTPNPGEARWLLVGMLALQGGRVCLCLPCVACVFMIVLMYCMCAADIG